jgi:RHS repeat-associated protein
VEEYIYNGLGQLATVIEDGVARHYLVDPTGFGNVVGEYDNAGNLVSRYTHGLGLIAKDENYYTFDGNGNTSELTDATGEIVNYYVYEPFGATLDEVENTENAFRFVGQFGIMQMADDLLYMRNRFYAPSLGRFMAEDPIGLAGGDVNFNRYVLNDPVSWVDPDGLHPHLPEDSDSLYWWKNPKNHEHKPNGEERLRTINDDINEWIDNQAWLNWSINVGDIFCMATCMGLPIIKFTEEELAEEVGWEIALKLAKKYGPSAIPAIRIGKRIYTILDTPDDLASLYDNGKICLCRCGLQ